MRLFETSGGFVFSFGFNMETRKPQPRHIAWCDPQTKEWAVGPTNQAGTIETSFDFDPEFVREVRWSLVAYQPGICVELQYVGPPTIWIMRKLEN